MFNSFKSRAIAAFALMAASGFAAAEGTGADAVFSALTAKVTSLETAAWGLLSIVLIAIIGMKLVKKFASKST